VCHTHGAINLFSTSATRRLHVSAVNRRDGHGRETVPACCNRCCPQRPIIASRYPASVVLVRSLMWFPIRLKDYRPVTSILLTLDDAGARIKTFWTKKVAPACSKRPELPCNAPAVVFPQTGLVALASLL